MDDIGNRFLLKLFEQTQGDSNQSASLYSIGELLNLDRETSLRTAEMLMGSALVEIRSLSGAIGLTADGIHTLEALSDDAKTPDTDDQKLCRTRILNTESIRWVEKTVAQLKGQIDQLKGKNDSLAELTADLKTIESQLMSPHPKTAVVREVLRSVREQMEERVPELSAQIEKFLED